VCLKDLFIKTDINIVSDSELKKRNLSEEKDLVRRMLEIHFKKYSFLPDADIIIYKKDQEKIKIYCILSVKNSFRERGFETTYWKLKLTQNAITKHIKVFMITPDKDDEINSVEGIHGPRKTRVVLEHELDSIYIAKDVFEKTKKVKQIDDLFTDILKLVEKNVCK